MLPLLPLVHRTAEMEESREPRKERRARRTTARIELGTLPSLPRRPKTRQPMANLQVRISLAMDPTKSRRRRTGLQVGLDGFIDLHQ